MSSHESKTIELTRKRLGLTPRKGSVPHIQIMTGENAGQIFLLDNPETTLGRDESCEIQLMETGISRRHARFISIPGSVTLVDLNSTNGTYVSEKQIDKTTLSRGETISFGGAVLARFDYRTMGELEINQQIYEHVTSDVLTNTLKHDAFLERLNHQRSIALRDGNHFALALIRVDNFEALAKTSVHEVAYVLLKQLAEVLRRSTRLDDMIGRYDNETFIVYIHGTEAADSLMVANRIRTNVATTPFKLTSEERTLDIPLTASLGLAQWSPSVALASLTTAVEVCLAEAQKQGGNRVHS